jgi:hypothetical protein
MKTVSSSGCMIVQFNPRVESKLRIDSTICTIAQKAMLPWAMKSAADGWS